jgi:predicted PurR-regulated permease PerM
VIDHPTRHWGTALPDSESPYGRPGPPLARDAPFYRGFLWALGAAAALAIALAVQDATSVLVLILISAFLAIGLDPVVSFAQRRGVPRGWAVAGIAVLFLGAVTAVVFVLGGVLRSQVTSFINDAPHLLQDLRRNRSIARLDAKYHLISKLQDRLQSSDLADTALSRLLDIGASVVNAAVGIVVVFVLTLYFVAALPRITRAMYSLAPASRRERVAALGDEILRRVGGYALGAVLVATVAGTVTVIFAFCVGLGDYALALGLLVAVLDLMPLVGAILGAAIVCLVGLATSVPVGIACIVFYVIYEALEGYVIYPRVMRSSVDVPEYVTIVAVLIGGATGGIVGALLALPIAAALLLLVREVWVRRQDTG